MKKISLFFIGLLVTATLLYTSAPSKKVEKQRGVSWVAGHQPVAKDDFKQLVKNHVNWIVQTPFGWQTDYKSPSLRLATDGGMWGESDVGIATTTRLAKESGIKTLLKPHIWMRPRDGKWRMDIEMDTEADWQNWFENYRTFILHYAKLAQKNGIAGLCIGTELHKTAVLREKDWRRMISEIREIYDGELTYAANWYKAFEEIKFWDALDFIGIQAYFPLAEKENPAIDDLRKGWQPHIEAIEELSRKYKKPVLFTEIGYRSSNDAAIRPWEWPKRGSREIASTEDLQTQANCYEAFFQEVWGKEWFAGAYFWKWFPNLRNPNNADKRFTPQGKPAEKVMAEWYNISK